jgi:hypothetical protein
VIAVAKQEKKIVTVNRREKSDRRGSEDRRKQNFPVATERRTAVRREKVARRRQIDPTTCERDYNVEEMEFMNALDLYKRTSGRMFPTCSEILEVFRSLGYEKRTPAVACSADIPAAAITVLEPAPPVAVNAAV